MLDNSAIAGVAIGVWALAGAVAIGRIVVAQRRANGRIAPEYGPLIGGIANLSVAPIPIALMLTHFQSKALAVGTGIVVVCIGIALITVHFVLKREWSNSTRRPSRMTFREKSALATILAMLVVYGFYAVKLWGTVVSPTQAAGALIGSTFLMIIIAIVAHIGIAIRTRPEAADERDKMVELRSARNAYRVLAVGAWCVILLAIASTSPVMLAYGLMGAFVVAEIVKLASALVYYRIEL
jgi:hypothetical protein